MEVLKYILSGIYILICVVIIILTLLQKKGQEGLSGAIVGSSSSGNFYEKNKGRTKEGSLKKWTIIFGIIFAIFTIALGIVYVIE